MSRVTSYAVVTPAHNESDHLRRLTECMLAQSLPPATWVIVDNASTDGTAQVLAEIDREIEWAHTIYVSKDDGAPRGAPVVRAFHAGLEALGREADVVTKLDADVTFEPDFFARIVAAFDADERLGITGGLCYEQDGTGTWRPEHVSRGHVRGATRAYRKECLPDVLPLEERMGWDGIDELRARVAGWETQSLDDLPFKHHRALGAREHRWQKWIGQGRMAYFMGYAPWYLAGRTVFRSMREPRAIGMLWGFADSALRRDHRYPDPAVRAYLRRQQSLRALPTRIREALGARARKDSPPSEPGDGFVGDIPKA